VIKFPLDAVKTDFRFTDIDSVEPDLDWSYVCENDGTLTPVLWSSKEWRVSFNIFTNRYEIDVICYNLYTEEYFFRAVPITSLYRLIFLEDLSRLDVSGIVYH
jgi:hypothetical protein